MGIKAKQIQNCLDTVSAQEVNGEKHYVAPQTFFSTKRSIIITDGYIHFVRDPQRIKEEGNSRFYLQEGQMIIEVFQSGIWTPVGQ